MKWNTHDADVYLNAKEYIDTAVIPLISVDLGDQFKSAVSKGGIYVYTCRRTRKAAEGQNLPVSALYIFRSG